MHIIILAMIQEDNVAIMIMNYLHFLLSQALKSTLKLQALSGMPL